MVFYTAGDYVEGRWTNPHGIRMMIRGAVDISDSRNYLEQKVWVGVEWFRELATHDAHAGKWKRADREPGIHVWRTEMWRIPRPVLVRPQEFLVGDIRRWRRDSEAKRNA
ncbi:hypothetical protein RB601_001854 [Gaeumannomyces tritici]